MADESHVTNFAAPAKRPRIEPSSGQNYDSSSSPTTTQDVEGIQGDRAIPTSETKPMFEEPVVTEDGADERSGSQSGENGEGEDDSDSDNVSEISDLSGLSEAGWRPIAGPIAWVQKQIMMGVNPREVLKDLISNNTSIPDDLNDMLMWRIIVNILSEPAKRSKLSHINTLNDVIHLMSTCKKILVLTGAGVSVPCGIPDFRSRDGIYARLAVDWPDLHEPQDMFDIRFFMRNPRPFFKFAKEIYPGQFEPSRSHRFIRKIEENGRLLRNYTQNIDTLEQVADIENVIQCHGSFATATCVTCKYKVDADDIRTDIMNQVIPRCPKCSADSPFPVMKPDIVFFGEGLPDEFHQKMEEDKDECDLLIVIGSSLKVRPVALIPNSLPANVPQILINREPLRHLNFDVELLGDCDVIVNELCHRLGEGWNNMCVKEPLEEVSKGQLLTPPPVGPSSPQFRRNMSNLSNISDTACMRTELESVHLQQEDNNSNNSNLSDSDRANSKVSWSLGKLTEDEEFESGRSLEMPSPTKIIEDNGTCSRDSGTYDMSTGADTDNHSDIASSSSPKPVDDSNSAHASDDSIEVIRSMWQSSKHNIASSLPERSFLCVRPSRYVFPGAEVYSDDEGNDESDNESFHSSHADNGVSSTSLEEHNEKEGCSVDPSFKEKLDKIDGLGCRNGIAQHTEGMGDHAS